MRSLIERSWMRLHRHVGPFLHKNLALLLAIAVGLVVLWMRTSSYLIYFADDAFISLRYADRLRSGLGFSWNDTERVEGATNFLWVFVIGLIGFIKQDLVQVGRWVGFVCTGWAIATLAWAVRAKNWRASSTSWFVMGATVSLGPILAWTAGGLETPMVLAGLGSAIAFSYAMMDRKTSSWPLSIGLGLSLAVLALTRPDGTMFTATFCAGLVVARGLRASAWKDAIVAGAISSAAFGALSVFRKLYFGNWFPNTAFKLFASGFVWTDGIDYITQDYTLWLPLLFIAVISLLLGLSVASVRKHMAVLVPSLALWLTYVALIRGDHMPQRRHLVPALFLLVAIGAELIKELAKIRGAARAASWHIGAAVVAGLLWLQVDDPQVRVCNNSEWTWEGKPFGYFLRDAFAPQKPLVAVDAAGGMPYFSRLPSIDMLGLNDAYLANNPPERIGVGLVGHELGDGEYLLRRKPDIVVWHLPYGKETPMWRGGWEMYRSSKWPKYYQKMYYRTIEQPLDGLAYIRHIDGMLEPKWNGNNIDVPLYLLATSKEVRLTLDEKHNHLLLLEHGARSTYTGSLTLPLGKCSVAMNATKDVKLTAKAGSYDVEVSEAHPQQLVTTQPETLTLKLHAANGKEGRVFAIKIECQPQA